MKMNVDIALNKAQFTHLLTSGIQDWKHVCAEGGHFKYIAQINLCRKQTSISHEYLP